MSCPTEASLTLSDLYMPGMKATRIAAMANDTPSTKKGTEAASAKRNAPIGGPASARR